MVTVKPFAGLLPPPGRAAEVSAVPYDVLTTAEARALARGRALSFLRVSRSELEMADDATPYGPAVYERAAANFARLRREAPLLPDPGPRFYLYAIAAGMHVQVGWVVAASVDDYDDDRIRKHEKTRQEKEDDRTRHTLAVRAHTGPVFLLYHERPALAALATATVARPPVFDFLAEDGSRHRLWRLPAGANATVERAFAEVGCLYVADGHHRAKSASRVRAECRAANPGHTGHEAYNRFLAVAFPHDQLRILPYNRVVRDLGGRSPEEFVAALGEEWLVTPGVATTPAAPGEFRMCLGGTWHTLTPRRPIAGDLPEERLDVSVLQDRLLTPVLGIADPRTSDRIAFVGGSRGLGELARLIAEGGAAVAFALHPTTVAQLVSIADAGRIMPPKSTWFDPKLRDGLVCHLF